MGYTVLINSTQVGVLEKIIEELNGHEEVTLYLENSAANRTLVSSDKDLIIKWNTTIIYKGILTGADYQGDILEGKGYNKVYEKMARKLFTGTYKQVAANTILAAICTAAGVTAGSCPTTLIGVRFEKSTCLDAAIFVAMSCNKDYWATDTTFNIGDRGTSKGTVVPISLPKRGIDRAKQRNRVLVRGVDVDGNVIYGEAKSVGWTSETDRPIVLNEKRASDTTTLDNVAAKQLEELEKESSGVKVPVSPDVGNTIYPGDTVTIERPDLELDGTFKVWKTTKKLDQTILEVDRPELVTEKRIDDLKRFEDLGIYPIPNVLISELKWEGESDEITKKTGTVVVADATASGGYCIKRAYTEPNDTMWYGPYKKIGAGEFYAIFVLKRGSIVLDENFITLDVYSSAGGGVIVSITLKPSDLTVNLQAYALRFRTQEDWDDVQLRGHSFKTGKADLYMDWVGAAPADIPFETVTVLTTSTGVDPSADSITIDSKTLHVVDISTGVDPASDATDSGITFSSIADSGWGGTCACDAGPAWNLVRQVTVNGAGYSQPMIVKAYWRRTSGYSDWAHVQFELIELTNIRHTWYTEVNTEQPDGLIEVTLPMLYTSATVLALYARSGGGETVHIDGRIEVFAKNKHSHDHDHTIWEPSPYRGQNDLDVTSHNHSNPTHDHTIWEPTPRRGVDLSGGYGSQKHRH